MLGTALLSKNAFRPLLFLFIVLCHTALLGAEHYGAIEIGGKGVKAYVIDIESNLTKISYRNGLNTSPQSGITEHQTMNNEMVKQVTSDIVTLKKILVSEQKIPEHNIFIIASSAINKINNRPELEANVKNSTHLVLHFIDEKEESTFAFYGSVPKEQWHKASMIDIGGGNTKVAWLDTNNTIDFFEIPLGTVSTTQHADILDTNASFQEKCSHIINKELSVIKLSKGKETLFASGGIFWATAYLKTNGHLESFVLLEKADFENLIALFSQEQRKECTDATAQCYLLGYYGAKNLVAGALLAKETIETMQFFNQKVYFVKDGAWVIGWLLTHTQ